MEKIIIYQVLPRLFGNTNSTCIPWGTKEQNGVGKFSDFTPERLKEIKSLGTTHIWYTGIIEHATATDYSEYGIKPDNKYVVKGLAGSPYAIKDYYDIDPDLADDVPSRMSEFEALIERTHEAGMKVIMDFVPNHVARQYSSDAAPAGVIGLGEGDNPNWAFSPLNNFYYLPGQTFSPYFNIGEGDERYNESPAKVTGNDCFTSSPSINDWYETVKLNYGVDHATGWCHFNPIPNTWIKMRDILLFWAAKGVDAFRCDMAEMVPVEFWEWCIAQVKESYPDMIFIAEVYNPNQYYNYVKRGEFTYLYDKVGLYDTLKDIVMRGRHTGAITKWWQSIGEVKENMLHFTENHDEQRSASHFFAGNPHRAFPLFALSALIDSNPIMLYFGQELGEAATDAEGFSGQDGRTTIFDYWSVPTVRQWITKGLKRLSKEQKEIRNKYKKLLNVAAKEKGISNGLFFDLMYVNGNNDAISTGRVYLFARYFKKDLYIVAVNFRSQNAELDINIPSHLFEYFKIEEGEFNCKELLSGNKGERELSQNKPFKTLLSGYETAIWKCSKKR
ncbi:MAG: alpha-amylase family protein [Bacteroidales bacterium]|nr:alpha-amylase family protein [Bacteroidales bacterium]